MDLCQLLTKGLLVIQLSSPELLLSWLQAKGISAQSAEVLWHKALIPSMLLLVTVLTIQIVYHQHKSTSRQMMTYDNIGSVMK